MPTGVGGGGVYVVNNEKVKQFDYLIEFSVYDGAGNLIIKGSQHEFIEKDLTDIPRDEWRTMILGFQANLSNLLRSKINNCAIKGESGPRGRAR